MSAQWIVRALCVAFLLVIIIGGIVQERQRTRCDNRGGTYIASEWRCLGNAEIGAP